MLYDFPNVISSGSADCVCVRERRKMCVCSYHGDLAELIKRSASDRLGDLVP